MSLIMIGVSQTRSTFLANALGDDFAEILWQETSERFLQSSFDRFAARSTVAKFLPCLHHVKCGDGAVRGRR